MSAPYSITSCRRFFAEPATPRQRQYEALRAFYLEGLTSAQAAERFGCSPGAFRVLCHGFRRGELPEFFAATRPGPRDQPKKSAAQERIAAPICPSSSPPESSTNPLPSHGGTAIPSASSNIGPRAS